jgi:hypothetical protein
VAAENPVTHYVVRLPGGQLLAAGCLESFSVFTSRAAAATWARIYSGQVEEVRVEFPK